MKKTSAVLSVLATLMMAASATYAQSECTNATLKGSYGFNFNGTTGTLPLAIVGVAKFDGDGNFPATYSISSNGTVNTGVHITGTYKVNPDCTGSATDMTNDLHYTLVVFRRGAEMFLINTDTGNT